MNDPRDTVVGDALRRLDIPDHAPEFWDRLEARLAGEPAGSDETTDQEEETTVVDLQRSPAARRAAARNRTPMLALAAAVAVVVALVVGLGIFGSGGDDESQLDVTDPTETTEPTETPDTTAPETTSPDMSTTTTTEVDPAATQLAAEELAGEWLTRLRAGEVEAAHAMLDGPSQERLPLEQFREVSTALAEGAGAFSAEGVTSTTVVVEPADGPVARVVTFVGEVQREGMIETAAYPVVVTGDEPDVLGIGFVLDGPTIELEQLSSPTETRTSPVRMTTPESAEVWVSVDGSEPDPTLGGPAIVDVEAVAGAGTHILTVIATVDGVYTATSVTVVVP